MNLIYKDFSMLTGLPASQPTTLKVINVQNLNHFKPIGFKLGMQTQMKQLDVYKTWSKVEKKNFFSQFLINILHRKVHYEPKKCLHMLLGA